MAHPAPILESAWPSIVVAGDLARARREWLHTHGAGAYASSTIAGMPARRYHGLLIAALDPPQGRHLGRGGSASSCAPRAAAPTASVSPRSCSASWPPPPSTSSRWARSPGLADGDAPHAPGGCVAHAAGVAELLRALCGDLR